MSCCSICASFFLRSHSRDHFRNWQLTVSNTFFCVLCANTSFCLAHDKWKVHFNEHWTMAQCSSVSLHLIIFDYGWTPRGFSLQSPAANGIYYVMSLLILMLSTRKTHDKCSFASQFTRHQALHTSILCCVFSNASGLICGTKIPLWYVGCRLDLLFSYWAFDQTCHRESYFMKYCTEKYENMKHPIDPFYAYQRGQQTPYQCQI